MNKTVKIIMATALVGMLSAYTSVQHFLRIEQLRHHQMSRQPICVL